MNNQEDKNKIITKLKQEGRSSEIQKVLDEFPKQHISKQNAYLTGKNMDDYLYDMGLIQLYAKLNRKTMKDTIVEEMDLTVDWCKESVHNYIDIEDMILRKGAVSAKKDEILIVPINMQFGSLLCSGKGNEDWNYSCAHGAGRLMSRGKAKQEIDLEDYANSMEGIYTTCVGESTLDEAPKAYKDVEEIIKHIEPTVDVIDILKTVYNFKSN